MKKFTVMLLLLSLMGCVTVKIPKHLSDEFPYKENFSAVFDETYEITMKSLRDLGWKVSDTTYPAVLDQDLSEEGDEAKQVLIFTDVRQTPFFLSSRYMSLNVIITSVERFSTDVEIRYSSITPILFKNIESYQNNPVVNKVFNRIRKQLN